MTTGKSLSPSEVEEVLSQEWGLSPTDLADELPPDPLLADYIRAALSGQCGLGRARVEPVYVTRLTNLVGDQLSVLWPRLSDRTHGVEEGESEADPIRRVLDTMEDLRDCEHVGNGYWLPAPVRLVKLSGQNALVVGARPTSELEAELGGPIARRGVARTVACADLMEEWTRDSRRWQSLDAWKGFAPSDLSRWLDSERQRARESLVPSSSEVGEFEVYWPGGARPAQPQWFRWMPADQLPEVPDRLVLCRIRAGYFGQRRYWWGDFTGDRRGPRLKREAEVEPLKVRRLQYALDADCGNPTSVRIQADSETLSLALRSAVPPEERRLFVAIASDESDSPGRYPIRLRASKAHADVIKETLRALSVEIY